MADLDEKEVALVEEDEVDTEDYQDENENIEEQLIEENIKPTRKLDYSLQTPQERNELVKKIIHSYNREKKKKL